MQGAGRAGAGRADAPARRPAQPGMASQQREATSAPAGAPSAAPTRAGPAARRQWPRGRRASEPGKNARRHRRLPPASRQAGGLPPAGAHAARCVAAYRTVAGNDKHRLPPAHERSFSTARALDEIRRSLRELPGPDNAARGAGEARARPSSPSRPARSAGWRSSRTGWPPGRAAHPPRVERPRVAVFAGNHGVAARGVSAYPAAVTAQMVQDFLAGGRRSTSWPSRRRRSARLRDGARPSDRATSPRGRR